MVVVVLGNRLESTDIHDHLRGRVDLGLRLLAAHDEELIVMSGGQSNQDVEATEAEVMAAYAEANAVSADRILCDDRAKDTIGNAYFTRRLLEDQNDVSEIRLATSCYHATRALFVFENCYGEGYEVTAPECYAADIPASEKNDTSSMSLNRRFFDAIEPGDMDAIRQRMIETHSLYSEADFAPSPEQAANREEGEVPNER